jgi:predicted dehydrogenase
VSAAPLRVGVIGASIDAGWARFAHMPALAAIPEIEVVALATTREESAIRSAAAFGVPHGYGDTARLLADPDVDLVLVSVKAPLHEQVALAAIAAGKHLFVEWPMGANLAQSEAITEKAEAAGLRGFVGVQARYAPAARHAAQLIADGYLGQMTAVNVYGAFAHWSEPLSSGYSANVESGANVLTIPGGHGLDLMRLLAGGVATLNARTVRKRETVLSNDDGPVRMTAPDAFAAVGTLRNGVLFSAHFDGMAPRGEVFRVALTGDRGELVLEADGMPEIAPLRLAGTRAKDVAPAPIPIPEPEEAALAPTQGAAYNPFFMWRQIARDMREGRAEGPGLASALESRRLVEAIALSAARAGAMIAL